jgi:hypothetical protein
MMLRGALTCAIVHVASPALRPPSSAWTRLEHTHHRPTGCATSCQIALKCLHRPVQSSRVFLTRGQNERCESSSSRQGPAHAPRPPGPSVRRKRHEQRYEQQHGPWSQTLSHSGVRARPGREDCRAWPPSDQLNFPSLWREERPSSLCLMPTCEPCKMLSRQFDC